MKARPFVYRFAGRERRRAAIVLLIVGTVVVCCVGCGRGPGKGSVPSSAHLDVKYGRSASGSPLSEDVFSPNDRRGSAPMIIVVHGGGFTSGNAKGVAQYAKALAAVGFVAAGINYTLVRPHHAGYPEQVNEVRRAIQWNIANARRFGADPDRVALLGFSAGGYLAAMAGLLDSNIPGRPVRAVVTLSAPLDLPAIDRLLRARLAACGYRRRCPQLPHAPLLSSFGTLFEFLGCPTGHCSNKLIREASPTSHVSASAPPFLIFNSSHEFIPKNQATDMGRRLRHAGVGEQVVIVPGTRHATEYADEVSPKIVKFMKQRLGGVAPLRRFREGKVASSGGQSLLLTVCAIVAGVSVLVVAIGVRRRQGALV